MSQEQLLKAAVPSLAEEIGTAGANLPNLAGLASAAIAKAQEELVKGLTAEFEVVMVAADAKIEGLVNQRTSLQKSLDKVNADMSATVLKKTFAAQTNNLFPLRKDIGMPTNPSILARFPKIDAVPEDWVPTVTSVVPAAR